MKQNRGSGEKKMNRRRKRYRVVDGPEHENALSAFDEGKDMKSGGGK